MNTWAAFAALIAGAFVGIGSFWSLIAGDWQRSALYGWAAFALLVVAVVIVFVEDARKEKL